MDQSILDGLDQVVQYCIIIGPSIVAILGVVASIITAVVNCKKAVSNGEVSSAKLNKRLDAITAQLQKVIDENEQIKAENLELKKIAHRVRKVK